MLDILQQFLQSVQLMRRNARVVTLADLGSLIGWLTSGCVYLDA